MINQLSLRDIETARNRLRGIVLPTPLVHNKVLSAYYGVEIYLKLESLQYTGAFKLRGAYNALASYSEEERKKGVVCASSGNHAQGVAYAAKLLGVDDRTTIFMPEGTPDVKVRNASSHGRVTVQKVGSVYDETRAYCAAYALQTGAINIEAYNDWSVIAGQGTIGLEIQEQLPETKSIIVPIGGGGLISGIGLAAKSINPSIWMYGVRCYSQLPPRSVQRARPNIVTRPERHCIAPTIWRNGRNVVLETYGARHAVSVIISDMGFQFQWRCEKHHFT